MTDTETVARRMAAQKMGLIKDTHGLRPEEMVRFTGMPDMRLHLYYVGEGRNLRISNMFDVDGVETDDPEAATSIVAELPDGNWLAAECHGGDIVARQPS